MSVPEATLKFVLVCGPGMKPAQDTIGGVIYRREPHTLPHIAFSVEMPSRKHRLRYGRDDSKFCAVTRQLPLRKIAGIEFCGPVIDQFVNAVTIAGPDGEACAKAIQPLRGLFMESMRVHVK